MFSDVQPDPTLANADWPALKAGKPLEENLEARCMTLAMGGGSTMDAGRINVGAAMLLTSERSDFM